MSSTSPTFEWPDRNALRDSVQSWAKSTAQAQSRLLRVGYVAASNANGTDFANHLEVVCVVEQTDLPPAERQGEWNLAAIPVPTQALVYTAREWSEIIDAGGWLAQKFEETVWVYEAHE